MSEANLRDIVREKYGEAARRAATAGDRRCGQVLRRGGEGPDCIGSLFSFGNRRPSLRGRLGLARLRQPTALAELNEGETVLDLGSGGGIDVLLSARRVGPTGKVYGLDMTDDMLALARENQRVARVTNVEFLKGELRTFRFPTKAST